MRAAYREQARYLHPDMNNNSPEAVAQFRKQSRRAAFLTDTHDSMYRHV